VDWGQQFSFWRCVRCLVLVYFWFLPSVALAGDVVVVGGTERQKRFVTCVAEVAADELRALPNSDQPMTFVILEHQKFLQTRDAFNAHRTKLAFSSLRSGEYTSLPVCSRTLIRLCGASRMNSAILRPRVCLKITPNSPLSALDGGLGRRAGPMFSSYGKWRKSQNPHPCENRKDGAPRGTKKQIPRRADLR